MDYDINMLIAIIYCYVCITSSQETMTCSRTSDTFQLPSSLPSTARPPRARIGKQGPKGDKGEMGSKGSKGDAQPISALSQQIEGKKCFKKSLCLRQGFLK